MNPLAFKENILLLPGCYRSRALPLNLAGKGIKSNKLILCQEFFGEHEAVHCGHVKSQRFAHSNLSRAVINNTQRECVVYWYSI